MKKIGRNKPCPCGSGKKYKKCCMDKNKLELVMSDRKKISRRDLISAPYRDCPSCKSSNSYGVFVCLDGAKEYTRECFKCGYEESFKFPKIHKKIIYLDQFIISNLVKLLDKSHPSHEKVKSNPFWESLFIKLEKLSKSQAIVCPDSFYHLDESLVGDVDFKLLKRLYEHFSGGATLYPGQLIEENQVSKHFEGWLNNDKIKFVFNPEEISFEDLHKWTVGLMISVGGFPYNGQLQNLVKTNKEVERQLKNIWQRWQKEKDVKFVDRVKEEALGFGKGLIDVAIQFSKKQDDIVRRMANKEHVDLELDDLFPPLSNDLIEDLFKIARRKGLLELQVAEKVLEYFKNADLLLEVPCIRINSVISAGLAHMAANGKRIASKSTVDSQFISCYLPYCDAVFIDKESELLLKYFPKNTPEYLKLKDFHTKIFSLRNKDDFLVYLEEVFNQIPEEQINIIKDMKGGNFFNPYWEIIDHEKRRNLD